MMPSHRSCRLIVALAALASMQAAGWVRAAELNDSDAEMKAQLEALGYLEAVSSNPDPTRSGVALHDPERASAGINVYCSVYTPEIKFLDMKGKVLHTIRLPDAGTGADCMLEPDGAGRFIALVQPNLIQIDWDSRVSWTSQRAHHHDFAVAPNGDIHTFSQRPGTVMSGELALPILDQTIAVVRRGGSLVREIAFKRLFADRIPKQRLARMAAHRHKPKSRPYLAASDVYHPNSIEILQRDSALGRRGDWLVCLRNQNLVAVVDAKLGIVRWTFGPGVLDGPHHPSVLANGNLLVFDNGTDRGWSRVIEINPASRKIIWQYHGTPRSHFFSKARGSAQELSNGNVLITESTKGRVFEVTRSGEIVWDFWNPDRTDLGLRPQIYRMIRLAPEELPRLRSASAD
jgi:hypothetical protein